MDIERQRADVSADAEIEAPGERGRVADVGALALRRWGNLRCADRYQLEDQIGSGRVASVWRAWDEVLDRAVAIKALHGSLAHDEAYRETLRAQAHSMARLSHPGIVGIHDFGEAWVPGSGHTCYLVMDLLEGESLASRLSRGALQWRETAEICQVVASALAFAHAAGIVHPDVRAANVFLSTTGVKVLDFGADGETVTAAENVRALGVVIGHCVTGRLAPDEQIPPEVPAEIRELRARCLGEAADRPTAREVAGVLAEAVKRSDGVRPARWRRRDLTAAGAAVVLGLSLALWVVDGPEPPRSEGVSTIPVPVEPGVMPSTTPFPPPPGSPSVSASTASATTGPTPTEAPSSSAPTTPGTPTTRPSPSRPHRPPPHGSPRPPSSNDPRAGLERFRQAVDQGVATGQIRPDVGVDLNNLVRNLLNDLNGGGPVNLRARIAELRGKIATRVGEHAITPWQAARLNAILSTIG